MAETTQNTTNPSRWSLKLGGDKPLWVIFIIFAFLSVFVVYSSTTSSLYGSTSAVHHLSRLVKQLAYVFVGVGAVWVVHKFDYQTYHRLAKAAYYFSLFLMVLTMFVGVRKFDAQRWLEIPIIHITFQPSDLLKVTTVLMLSLQLARRQKLVDRQTLFPGWRMWRDNSVKAFEIFKSHTLPVFGPIMLSCGIIAPENLSTALLMGGTSVILLIIGRVSWRDIGRFLLLAVVGGGLLIGAMELKSATTDEGNRTGTWGKRINAFFHPEKVREDDPDYFYQIDQATIAIAMGEIAGRGAGKSVQRHMLPKAESDYAFAFLVEEYGFLGAVLVLVLYLWIFYRAIVIFNRCGTAFPCLLVLGLAFLITSQGLLNMMVATGMMFQTGLALPLISQGGSSELFTSIAMGMILGVSRQIEEKTLSTPKGESMLETNKKR